MFAQFLFAKRKYILYIFFVLIALSAFFTSRLQFEHHLERFFPDQDEDMAFLETFKSEIEPDDLFLLIAIDYQQNIFDTAFWIPFHKLVKACEKLPFIQSATAVTNIFEPIKTPFGFSRSLLIDPNNQLNQTNYQKKLASDDRFWGGLINKKGTAALIVLKTDLNLDHQQAEMLNDSLFVLLQNTGFEKYHVAGKVNSQTVFVRKTNQELLFYVAISIVLLAIILYFIFPAFWGIVVPLFAVLVGLLFFMAYMYLSGQSLDIMSSLFPILMLIFGMSDAIHLQTKYLAELQAGKAKIDAMQIALKEIGLALLLTSVTTTIGFATLYLSHIPLIRQFGINAAVGVMIAYWVVITFAATFLSWFDANKIGYRPQNNLRWQFFFNQWYQILISHKKWLIGFLAVALVWAAIGISKISTNTYLLSDVPQHDRLRQDFAFVEEELGGVRSIELAILPNMGKSVFDKDVIEATEKLQIFLTNNQVSLLQSPTTFFKTLHKAHNGGLATAYQLPTDSVTFTYYKSLIDNQLPALPNNLVSKSGNLGRITGKMKDTGSDSLMYFNKKINNWINENINSNIVTYRITGTGMLVDKNHEYLRKSLFNSLILAFILVGIIFAFLFKDWRMLPISFIPNVIPLLIAGGAMGWLGIELKALTSIIFTTSFGIAVDDTIHLLGRYRLERHKGFDHETSIKHMLQISGKAVVLTTIVLIAGFASLAFSDFTGTYYIGILVSITLISALISDLILIPYMLQWIKPKNN